MAEVEIARLFSQNNSFRIYAESLETINVSVILHIVKNAIVYLHIRVNIDCVKLSATQPSSSQAGSIVRH
jgi:hypothetical protein